MDSCLSVGASETAAKEAAAAARGIHLDQPGLGLNVSKEWTGVVDMVRASPSLACRLGTRHKCKRLEHVGAHLMYVNIPSFLPVMRWCRGGVRGSLGKAVKGGCREQASTICASASPRSCTPTWLPPIKVRFLASSFLQTFLHLFTTSILLNPDVRLPRCVRASAVLPKQGTQGGGGTLRLVRVRLTRWQGSVRRTFAFIERGRSACSAKRCWGSGC